MKQIIIASSVLLTAGAIYGLIDYRQQTNSGRLNGLYKDEKYNSSSGVTSGVSFASNKEVDLEDYSRSPIRKEEVVAYNNKEAKATQEGAAGKTAEKEQPFLKVIKERKKVIKIEAAPVIEASHDFGLKEKTELIKTEPTIIYLASAEDSLDFRNREAKEVKMAMFSRAPIRKKRAAAIIVVNVDSTNFQ